jgi:hypothetical protein
VLSSLFQLPEIIEPKNRGDDFLNDVAIRLIGLAIIIVCLRIKSALNKLILTPVEHLTIDFVLIPVLVSFIGLIDGVKNHRGRIEHIGHCAGTICSRITVGHITDIFFVDGMTGCPTVAETHGQIVKRIKAQYGMSLDTDRAKRVCVLCKLSVVSIGFVIAEIDADLVDDLAHSLTSSCSDAGNPIIYPIGKRLVNCVMSMFRKMAYQEIIQAGRETSIPISSCIDFLWDRATHLLDTVMIDPIREAVRDSGINVSVKLLVECNHELTGNIVGMPLKCLNEIFFPSIPLINNLVESIIGMTVPILSKQVLHGSEQIFSFIIC